MPPPPYTRVQVLLLFVNERIVGIFGTTGCALVSAVRIGGGCHVVVIIVVVVIGHGAMSGLLEGIGGGS
jgi:hypothetical protein